MLLDKQETVFALRAASTVVAHNSKSGENWYDYATCSLRFLARFRS